MKSSFGEPKRHDSSCAVREPPAVLPPQPAALRVPMEHQALPTLQEVAATLQKLGVEHERQLSELRRQVELLETQVRSETPALPESQAPLAPAPDGHPESLPLEGQVQHPQETGERSEGSLRAMFTYPELPGMLSSGTLQKRATEDDTSSSSSSSLVSNPAGGKHITVTTTWASKQYRAPGLDTGDDKLPPNLKDAQNPVVKRESAHFKLHPFFNEAQRREGTGIDLTVGTFLEGGVLDEEGRAQGTIVLGVKEVGKVHGGNPTVDATFLGCSDPHYLWWMEHGAGRDLKERCWYHLCGERPGSCPAVRGKGKMIHLTKVRELNPDDFEESVLPFLKKKDHADAFDSNVARFNRWVENRGGPPRAGPSRGVEARPRWHGSDASEDEGGGGRRDESPQGKRLLARLEDLRKELRKAEKQAEDYRERKKKGRRSRTPPKRDGKNKRSGKDEKRRHSRSRGRKDKSPRTRSRSRKRRSSRDKKSRSRGRKRRKKDDTGSKDSGSECSDSEKEELFVPRRREGSKSPRSGDRGPFGEGPAVDYKDGDESSSDESDFQRAPSRTTKSSQLKLLSYSRRFPGRLASRMLLKMRQATARGLEGADKSKTPPVAMNHLLTVLQPSLQGKLGMRTLRELKTLAQCLDMLAQGQIGRGADLLSQRVKALERATAEGHWNSAQFLELLPPESSTLLERDEELYLAKEFLTEQKIKGYDRPYRQREWEPLKGRGKGKDSQKGEKGKGKEKKGREKDDK
eukprot:s2813_g4.t1